ncbi:hypothetical protein LCGC14_0223010 [marine sediment metagenome]|uniref:Uncharacterized protein n=1 Tax=marine sediment metagenome TaxID=412755 RepID=A0A0F9XFT4_9ZZZZ|nr:hypothetical protein [bacterium]
MKKPKKKGRGKLYNSYKCAKCGNDYEKGWSDAECAKECEENFSKYPDSMEWDMAVVCDNCYKLLMLEINELSQEDIKKLADDYKRMVGG